MSNSWLRLWHDMPNDPKWRTIARISGEPISLVQAIYIHLLVDASRNVTRGHADVTVEDMASSLDVTEEQVEQIYSAMQGRVMEGNKLTGWEKRQPKREDSGDGESGAKSAAERKREQRERERLAQIELEKQQCHEASRNVTTDTDTDTDTENIKTLLSESDDSNDDFEQFWTAYPKKQAKQDAAKAFRSAKLKPKQLQTVLQDITSRKSSAEWLKEGGKYIPLPATYIRGQRWLDEPVAPAATQPSHPVELPNGLKMSSYGAYL